MGQNTPLVANDNVFSWSCARKRTYDYCQRAYYYKYYGAQKGWDKFTTDEPRRLYILKNIKKADRWLEDILSKAVVRIFTENRIKMDREILAKHLCFEVIKNYNRDWMKIRAREWEKDPKNPNIFEVYYRSDPEFLYAKQDVYLNRLLMALNCFILSPLFEELRAVPFLSWKHLRRPDCFFINNLCIWCAPDMVWVEKGELKILNMKLGASDKSSRKDHRNAVNALMANIKYRFSLEKVKCLTFYFEAQHPADALEISEPGNLTKTIKEIEKSAAEMKSKISTDSNVYESDFPKRKCNIKKFDFCEFMEYCEKNGY